MQKLNPVFTGFFNGIFSACGSQEASRILFLLPAFYRNLGKRITKAPKIYFSDSALVAYLTGISDPDVLMKGPLSGPLFENLCVQEAAKIAFSQGVAPRLYYLRTHNGLEIDLLVEGANGGLHAFELKLSKTPRPGMALSLERFVDVFRGLNPESGSLVSLSANTIALTRLATSLSFSDYLETIKNIMTGRKGR